MTLLRRLWSLLWPRQKSPVERMEWELIPFSFRTDWFLQSGVPDYAHASDIATLNRKRIDIRGYAKGDQP